MSQFDPADLPRLPLTMSRLVGLEPAPLRRLLRVGLRAGWSSDELERHLSLEWELKTADANELLSALKERGWFGHDQDRGRWFTHLGRIDRLGPASRSEAD